MFPYSQLPVNEWFEFLRGFREYEAKYTLKEKENVLLDVYSLWLKTHNEKLKEKVIKLAEEIKQVDPSIKLDDLIKSLDKIKV
ncbi:MAG: hypothetical protein NC818_03330 [Candidatus Omnitrophica bacterium]|nr:hypothetical protein [Candidatus Omnitrophota bacterium]